MAVGERMTGNHFQTLTVPPESSAHSHRSEVVYVGFYHSFELVHKNEPCMYKMPPHNHNAIEIYFNMTDLPSVLLGARVYPFPKNTLMIIPPYCVHKVIAPVDVCYERFILTINTAWFANLMNQTDRETYRYLTDAQNPSILYLEERQKQELRDQFQHLSEAAPTDFFGQMQLFFGILDWIHRYYLAVEKKIDGSADIQVAGTAKTVSDILTYISRHLYESITVEEIAEHLFLNHDYVSRIFKKYMNTTIKQFITIQRITKAKQFLLEGKSVAETQAILGYGSYEHFFRTFKKVTGMTPKEFLSVGGEP